MKRARISLESFAGLRDVLREGAARSQATRRTVIVEGDEMSAS